MNINGREISNDQPPYIIAEISCNHCGDLGLALRLITAAKEAGADAVKFQCYEADTITLDCDKPDFIVKDGPWKGRKLHDLYRQACTPFEWFPVLFKHAQETGITIFSSVFDESSVDLLESLGCPAYKIASMEIVDANLIKYAAKTGKPLIISTGMADCGEIHNAYRIASRTTDVALLKCVSGYPTAIEEFDLLGLQRYTADSYHPMNFQSGISDHTLGSDIPIAATALGAVLIEKHFKIDGCDMSEDAAFSIYADDFADMIIRINQIWHAMQPSKAKSEVSSRQLRRSLYVVEDIKKGERFTRKNVRSIRPAYGLPPAMLELVMERRAMHDIERGTALTMQMLDW